MRITINLKIVVNKCSSSRLWFILLSLKNFIHNRPKNTFYHSLQLFNLD